MRHPRKLAWSVSLLVATACSSDVTNSSPENSSDIPSEQRITSSDRMLQRIGKGLARSLSDASVRAWVQTEMAASPYVEWRIPLRDKLLKQSNRPEVKRVAEQAALTSADLKELQEFPHLELYMPIESHRKGWQGTADIEVAVRRSTEDYVLFRTDGSARVVPANYSQGKPTLVLAISELDYDDVDLAVRGGSESGTGMGEPLRTKKAFAALPSSSFSEVATAFGTDPSQWSHLTYIRTNFVHDGGLAGSDEVEVFGSIDGGVQFCVRKANVQVNTDYVFDRNALGTTLAKAIPTSPSTLFVDAWEDDSGSCVLTGSDDHYGQVNLTFSMYGTIWGTTNPGHIAVKVETSAPL